MAITLTSGQRTALAARELVVREGAKFELDSGTFGFWTGLGPLTYDSVTYQGVGQLATASPITQVGSMVAAGLELQVAGLDQQDGADAGSLYTDLEDEDVAGRLVTYYRFYFDRTKARRSVAELILAEQLFKGPIDRLKREEELGEGESVSSSLMVYVESRAMEFGRRHTTRRTNEHQQALHSGDLFFNQVHAMQGRELFWGRTGQLAGGGGGGPPGGGNGSGNPNRELN